MVNQKLRVGMLGLQGSVTGHIQALYELGTTSVEVKLSKHLEGLDGLITPGEEFTMMYKLVHAFDVFKALKTFVHSGRAVYESCAGIIMLADHTLGGIKGQGTLGGSNVTVRRNVFGCQVDSAVGYVNPGESGGDTPLPAVLIRTPWVESVSSKVQVPATWQQTPELSPRVVAVRQGSLLTASFHPEVTSDRRVHRYFSDMTADYVQ